MRPAAAHHAAPPPGGSGEPPLRPAPGGHRKKGASVRAWLTVDSTGEAQVVEAGKHAIMRRTGLPGRDLRILDPVLSYPSTVLGRERAIVVNLEHIKAIITAQEVLFLNSTDPLVTPFVKKLQEIFRHRQAEKAPQETRGDGNNAEWANLYNLQAPQLITVAPHQNFPSTNEEGNADGEQQVAENARGLKLLPFEFVALEACLEAACSSLDNEAKRLEQEAHPALDKLTSKISTLNLERVRQIKSRLVAMAGRVQKLREYVDDTEDYINIMLDDKQNHLLQMGVVLSTATVMVSAFVALTGVFGMNITIELFDSDKAGMPEFLWTVGGGTMGCLFLYIAAIAWCKHKRLLE
ncbi:Magnesium transporter MRS2-3 [Sesamum angolense]|uniref:Magnesium transporter n=1 Tax=Sesamum angolense TaxID=2727404 RepID=A0AAE1WJY8_9LAMI|nr:Magnesium transporter MRS2-3 [Sesamum angolense]